VACLVFLQSPRGVNAKGGYYSGLSYISIPGMGIAPKILRSLICGCFRYLVKAFWPMRFVRMLPAPKVAQAGKGSFDSG
jgi:hypothetical protein